MTHDERRANIEERAARRLAVTPSEGSKPEHFGFYAERVHNGYELIDDILHARDTQFHQAANMLMLYYCKFTADVSDVRLINRVCLAVMDKGADRPTAWSVATNYHAALRAKLGWDFNLDNYTVVVMTEEEATPEVVAAVLQEHSDNVTKH